MCGKLCKKAAPRRFERFWRAFACQWQPLKHGWALSRLQPSTGQDGQPGARTINPPTRVAMPRITLHYMGLSEGRERTCYGLWGATNDHAMVGERLCCGWGASPSWMGSCDHLRPCPRQGPSTINVFQRVAMPSLVGCKALKMGVKAAVLTIRQCLST